MNPISSLKRIMLVAVLLLLTLTLHTAYSQENPLPETLSVTAPPQLERIFVADVTDNPPAPVLAPEISRGPNAVQTANIQVNFINDATSNWDAQPAAKVAFQFAVDIWATLLNASTPIVIDAYWQDLSSYGSGVLGAAGATTIHANNSSFPYANTWYPAALANARAGYDVNGSGTAEIRARFNSARSNWYFGTGNITPDTQYNFATVVLHEIGHGLGFFGSMFYDNGSGGAECRGIGGEGCWGYSSGSNLYPVIYDRFTESAGGTALINTGVYPNPSIQLGLQLTSDSQIYFAGANATVTHGSRVPLYAPPTWRPGSSYSHLAESFNGTPNALMTYSLSNGETNYHPGPVALAMFKDMGWNVNIPPVYQPPQLAQLPHQLLEMNTVRPNAFYVYDYTILVPGIVYDLSYQMTDSGNPGAGISFNGVSVSINPQPGWIGKTTATIQVKDQTNQPSSSTFTVVVTDKIYKVHLPTIVK